MKEIEKRKLRYILAQLYDAQERIKKTKIELQTTCAWLMEMLPMEDIKKASEIHHIDMDEEPYVEEEYSNRIINEEN